MKTLTAKLASAFTAAALLTGCSANVSINDDKNYDEQLTDTKHFTIDDPTDYSAIDINLKTGGITVKHTDDKTPSMDLECHVFADSEQTCQDISNHITALCRQKNGKMQISIVEKVSGSSVEDWIKENDEKCRVELAAVLNIPSAIDNISANVDTGNITFDSISGKMNAYVDIGNITCTDAAFTSDSYIECDTGNITAANCTYDALTMLKTDTGNIAFGPPAADSTGDAALTLNNGTIDIKNSSVYKITKGRPEDGSVTMKASKCTVTVSIRSGKINMGGDQEDTTDNSKE